MICARAESSNRFLSPGRDPHDPTGSARSLPRMGEDFHALSDRSWAYSCSTLS